MNARKLALASTLALLIAPAAHAWNYDTCNGNKRVWDGNNVTFKPSTVSFPSGSGWRSSLEAAKNGWNIYSPGSKFDFTFSYTSSGSYSSGDDKNSILVTSSYSWGSGTLGVAITRYKTCLWPFWGGKIKEVDVLFNPAWSWNLATNPTAGSLGYSSTLVGLHELGHAMGMKHENNVMASLNSYYANSGPLGASNDVHPHANDVGGARSGYGTSGTQRDFAASIYKRTGSGTSGVIYPPSTVYRGSTASFQYTMENRGTVNETSVGVKYYLSTDRTITTSDYYLGSAGFAINNATASTKTVNVTIPTSVPAGYYYFGFIIDPENYIGETDEGNNSIATTSRTYVSSNSPPNACYTINTTNGSAPLFVSVNASCSSDPNNNISTYTWTMGDGTTRTGLTATHTYYTAGYYSLKLTVKDTTNLTDTYTRTIYVNSSDPCGPIPVGTDNSKAEAPCPLLTSGDDTEQ